MKNKVTFPPKLLKKLEERDVSSSLRKLKVFPEKGSDFFSNDYLGLGQKVYNLTTDTGKSSKGSRLISGHSDAFERFERLIANWLDAEKALFFNSGYEANVGFFGSVPQRGDTVFYDEYIHASIRDGLQMSFAKSFKFQHQNIAQLAEMLAKREGTKWVVVESVYSMDGDVTDLKKVAKLCQEYGAWLVVDEAHSTGIYGEEGNGLVAKEGLQEAVFARIHTFGKAFGAHGAVIAGSELLNQYLVNFARSFIYTTAVPDWFLTYLESHLKACKEADRQRADLWERIELLNQLSIDHSFIQSFKSPIGSILIGGNEKTKAAEQFFYENGFKVKAILSPTVPKGLERLRISLHSFNTLEAIRDLVACYQLFLQKQMQ